MSDDERALLKAVWKKPTDLTARHVYADWLEEHGYQWEADAARYWCLIERVWQIFRERLR